MQNRGTIGIFTVVLILSALYILSFSYFSGKFESKAEAFATEQVKELPSYADLNEEEIKEEVLKLKQS